jgi:hypothetical protein
MWTSDVSGPSRQDRSHIMADVRTDQPLGKPPVLDNANISYMPAEADGVGAHAVTLD